MLRAQKKITLCGLILVIPLFLAARRVPPQGTDPCLKMQAQSEMNACEADRYAKVDADLNSIYKQVLSKYKSNTEFVEKLRIAQENWLKFRDADITCLYYQEDKLAVYGSVYPTCRSQALIHLTMERTQELKRMLNPEEGDVCAFQASQ